MLSSLASILNAKRALWRGESCKNKGPCGKYALTKYKRKRGSRRRTCSIGSAHSLIERELCLGCTCPSLWPTDGFLSWAEALYVSVMGSGPSSELLEEAASLFFFPRLCGDFYPSVAVCWRGLPELLTFIFPLIGSLKLNVITLVICKAIQHLKIAARFCSLLSRSHFFPDIKCVWASFDFFSCHVEVRDTELRLRREVSLFIETNLLSLDCALYCHELISNVAF